VIKVSCVSCGTAATHSVDIEGHRCLRCGDILEAAPLVDIGSTQLEPRYAHSLWRYIQRLPIEPGTEPVTLGEGMTPLRRCPQLDELFLTPVRIWVKDETNNPTGSFKDRLVSVAITHARQQGASVVTCASSGNAAASTAAYAASAGMRSVVFVPAATPLAKVNQARAYGAQVVAVPGDYSNSYLVCEATAKRLRWPNLTTTYLNAYGTAGLATVGYEILDQLQAEGESPDLVSVPVGSGPLLYGIDRGWREASPAVGMPATVPLLAVQAEGCAPIVSAYDAGADTVTPWPAPTTIASGISDPLRGYPEDGTLTLRIVRRVGGAAVAVTDEEIRSAATHLARRAGVLAEPTGAASLAGVAEYLRDHSLPPHANVVVCVTGHAFKDPQRLPEAVHPALAMTESDTAGVIASAQRGDAADEELLRLQDMLVLEGELT
jgi:threonine synthase